MTMIHRLIFPIFLTLLPLQAMAQLELNLTQGRVEALPIAITDFYAPEVGNTDIAVQMASVIRTNLTNSGLFRPLSSDSFVQSSQSIATEEPRFNEWRPLNVPTLVSGQVLDVADGRLRVEFRLWDVLAGGQLEGMAYMTTPENWRRIAHIISDSIFKRLTGEDGYFDTRIVYIAESGPVNRRVKRLAIMDQDGENHRYLTDGSYLVLTPRFSPNAQEITYLAYINNEPRVYLYNIDTGRQELLGNFPGMSFAPRFSPDGEAILMSLARSGNTDIFMMDLRSRQVRQITDHFGIDTSPSMAPDGRRIVFESDRGGSQQLYVVSASGGEPARITFGDGRYANPVWSPRGDLIAFTKMHQGKFYIGVIEPDGSNERLITTAYHVEGPSWSPNGRYLTYFKERPINGGQGREAKLFTIDLTGHNERVLRTPAHASDPAWSPSNP